MKVVHLRCDYMIDPVGFDFVRPTLGWKLEAEGFDRRQSAYRLQVATGDFAAPAFDSGKVQEGTSIGVRLDSALAPMTRYLWRVMAWDEGDKPTQWSETASFETGRYGAPWQAKWIAADALGEDHPALRKEIRLRGGVASARAYVCGVGLYELFINGCRVGDEQLTPFCNAYDKWLQYQTFDVTNLLSEGENALGAFLGNGWYKGRLGWGSMKGRKNVYGDRFALLCELVVTYKNGTSEVFGTDESWKAAQSPIVFSDIYDGETYDARLEQPGWDKPGFADDGWQPVNLYEEMGYDRLSARRSPPVRVTQQIEPVAVFKAPNGDLLADFGQNMTGWVALSVQASAGSAIRFEHAEVVDKEGNFYNANMRTAQVTQTYIAKGEGVERYAPHFTFFGFRYIRISGWPGMPQKGDLIAQVVHSDLERTGDFTCSDERVNRLYQNTVWGQRSNFLDVPTDCPQRDERMGWTGDAQVFCATASTHMQSDAFFRKYLFDIVQEQKELGFVPVVVPNFLRNTGEWKNTTAAWGDAATIIPWTLYTLYGDSAVLEDQYDSMKGWVDYITACDTEKRNLSYGPHHLGDWLAQDTNKPDGVFGATPTDLIASAYYAYSADIVSWSAAVLGKQRDASEYALLARKVRDAIMDEFVTRSGRIVSETQTAQVVALNMRLLPDALVQKAADKLAERVKWEDFHLTTGFVGTPYLCLMLSEHGYNEYAYRLLLSDTFPSWLYTVSKGATTMWERWNSIKEDGSMGEVGMNSFNHYAYGSIAEWMYRVAAGINPAEPGYTRALLRPMPCALLSHVQASVDTVSGKFCSSWALEGGRICLTFTIPANAAATIELPDAVGAAVTENGEAIDYCGPIQRGSGTYRYEYAPTGNRMN